MPSRGRILRRMPRVPQVVAFGGGGFSMESGNALLDDYVLAATGVERPKVCFLPTASGDADHYIVRFYRHSPRRSARRRTCRSSAGTAARPSRARTCSSRT